MAGRLLRHYIKQGGHYIEVSMIIWRVDFCDIKQVIYRLLRPYIKQGGHYIEGDHMAGRLLRH